MRASFLKKRACIAEILHDKLVATSGLVHHLYVVGRSLVVHAPATVNKLEAALLHQLFGKLLLGLQRWWWVVM
jgi:hypothetical protein